ncbi:MAG: hypothetical protein J6Y62_07665, partial [Clostridia bacterium]|nr:hypothetical protein [Clostridia bacterium]
GYQPVPNVTEMRTITVHNVSFQNEPVTEILDQDVPVENPVPDIPELSFAEATLKEIEMDLEARRGGEDHG